MAEKTSMAYEAVRRANGAERPPEGQQPLNEQSPSLVIDEIRQEVAHEALQAAKTQSKAHEAEARMQTPAYANTELKRIAYKRALKHARQQMRPDRMLFSEFMHLPPVETVAEAVSKTIGRPSGLLGSGILTLIGSLGYYYVTKHYGYDYNFGVFLMLSAAGFLAGWIIEFGWRLLRR